MTEHPNDDFDELLRTAARDYNRPGDTPRERMWTEIRGARARHASAPATPITSRPMWLLPLAAAAVLVIGIGIGRFSSRPPNGSQVATVPVPKALPIPSPAPESLSAPDTSDSSTQSAPRPTQEVAPRSTPNPPRSTRSQPFHDNSATTAYRLAVVEHLAGTEAMLTSFRAAAKRGAVDAQITTWAKNLLTTTRLLQASAAQEDPTMKRLLDDLELVLLQIAQYTDTGAHHTEELELIEHSIERRGVIGKLQTTLPARLSPAGT